MLQKIAYLSPDLPADKDTARPAPSSFRPGHKQRDAGGNDELRVAAQPADAFDHGVRAAEGGSDSRCVKTELGAQVFAGDLEPLFP